MEVMAPAGSRESLERAQAAGADAVYLGYASFSARAGAGNFDREQLEEALAFAHLHRMRVYVTVNTLVKDGELEQVYSLLELLNRVRADGVLVQDLGILRMARSSFPGLRIHASTQMALHNAAGVRWCARMGMKRAVLARECSLEEIRKCAGLGVEIETFCHGAQCVAVSGECLFSSMVGERSGNRGRCAQPCRKRYLFDGVEGAWLSPRDLCLRDRIPELAEAGAESLKIEGRLKRPEYVYTVTESYRQGVDSLETGRFRKAGPGEKEALRQIFDRGGFMEGYAFGTEDAGVIQSRTVNHQGIRVGRVEDCRGNLARVRAEWEIRNGDGLRIRHGNREAEMTYAGKDTPAGEIATLRLREGIRAEAGDEIWRLTDRQQLEAAMAAPLRKIRTDLELEAFPGKPLRLTVSDGTVTAEAEGPEVPAARTRETTAEEMERQIRKTGGTDFEAGAVMIRTAGAFVPVSALNELRREGLARLAEARREAFAFPAGPVLPRAPEETEDGEAPEGTEEENMLLPLWTVRTAEQAAACRKEGEPLCWYPEDFRPEALERLIRDMAPGDWLRLPEVCEEDTLEALAKTAERHRERLGGVVLGSVGQLGIRWPLPIGAGPGIPVMNREAARLLKEQGCVFVTASPELTGGELRGLTRPGKGLPRMMMTAYGRTQLMILHHCPARTALGLKAGHRECTLCDREAETALRGKDLEDERGYRFPLLRTRLPEGCLVRLMNALPTDLGDRDPGCLRGAEMTTETPEEVREIRTAADKGQRAPGESTRGHWHRPVD